MSYLLVRRILYCDDLFNTVNLGSFARSILDASSSNKSVDTATKLLGCCESTQRAMVELSVLLFKNGQGREQPLSGKYRLRKSRSLAYYAASALH